MHDCKREMAIERRIAEFELHQLEIETGAQKIGFAGCLLCWLDELALQFPEARDSIQPLTEKLHDQIGLLEDKLESDFADLLKVSDLHA